MSKSLACDQVRYNTVLKVDSVTKSQKASKSKNKKSKDKNSKDKKSNSQKVKCK